MDVNVIVFEAKGIGCRKGIVAATRVPETLYVPPTPTEVGDITRPSEVLRFTVL